MVYNLKQPVAIHARLFGESEAERRTDDSSESVLVKTASTWAFIPMCTAGGCTRAPVRLTRAQWLWGFNFFCASVHFVMLYLTVTSCNGDRFGTRVNSNCTAAGMEISIYRIKSQWEDMSASGYSSVLQEANPIRIDLSVSWFFGLSAVFHLLPVVAGPFDCLAFLYWKPMDNALCWWRWVEYSASAPLMVRKTPQDTAWHPHHAAYP